MNKQELIGDYKRISNFCETVSVNKVIQELEQLTEPQKVQVPQFVAEWIETCKENNIISLSGAFEYAKGEVEAWLSSWENQEIFALAWINGYEVEKEKRYLVRLKNAGISNSLLKRTSKGEWWFGINFDDESQAHTRKELEEAGFGEVFDSPLFEVEEVER